MRSVDVRTIYLDHNIIHHFVRGFPPGTEAAETAALKRAMGMYASLRFVVSDWNFLEPCRERDPVDGHEALVIRYADFLLALNPLYLPTVLAIKQAEMARCVYSHLGLQGQIQVPVFNHTYSQARLESGLEEVLLGYSLKDFMLYLVKRPKELDQYRALEQQTLVAHLTIREAQKRDLDKDPALQARLWREWFGSMLPDRGPDKRIIPKSDLQRVLQKFVDTPDLVLGTCPAIRAESVLSDVRANVGGRKPRKQDAIDLMHAVPALAYCDAMITDDKHLLRCAREVIKASSRNVILARTLSEAIQSLT
jgi:hypothetical protein